MRIVRAIKRGQRKIVTLVGASVERESDGSKWRRKGKTEVGEKILQE
jgi:hypothetical protein